MQDSIPAHLRHFLLDRLPFTSSSDPAFFYLTSAARDAKDRLGAQLGQHGALLFLAGQGGRGTTALLRYLAANSLGGRQWYSIDQARQDDAPSLLVSVRQTLEAHATSRQQHGVRQQPPPVIAIDHTDEQKPSDLAELLQWHAVSTRACPCILLFVGTEPLACCRAAAPQSFARRKVAEVTLRPLVSADTGALINHRLRHAGHQGAPLFTPEAVEQIQTLSDGLPRDILHLADIALYLGYHLGLTTIDGACIDKVAKYVPTASPTSRKRADTPALPQSGHLAFRWLVLALVLLIGVGITQWLIQDTPEATVAKVIEASPPASTVIPADKPVDSDRPDIVTPLPPQPPSQPEPQPHAPSSDLAGQPDAASSESQGEDAALIDKPADNFAHDLVIDNAVKQLQRPESPPAPAPAPPPAKAAQPITELLQAVTAGDRDQVQRLLHAGLSIDSRNDFGDTSLLTAVWHGRKEVVNDLLKLSPTINYRNKDGCTALFFAAVRGHAAIAATLLDHGAQIDLADRDGRTPLMAAAWNGHAEIVQLLLTHKADPNRASREGWTSLMFAALNGHTKIGAALLSHGANPNATNRDALDSRLLAEKHGHTDFLALLP
ncbi:MAG: ankyrin repeat domain-containing protein [Proteobacteria bacterium]|nr:ankyrin repeat domain-containing protein [Pseudomonadota bacterium]